MKEIKIRNATEKDIKEAIDISNVSGLQISGEQRAPSEKWFKAFIQEKQFFYVAEIDKKVVGVLIAERVTGDIGYLWEVGVKKDLRSKGIGSLLLKKFIEECKKRKFRFIIGYGYLNEGSLSFTRKHKFVEGESYKEVRLDLE